MSFRSLYVSSSPRMRSGCRSRWVTALSWRTNSASGATEMSRGPSHWSPRTWATWAWIWAKVAARADGTGWVVAGAGAAVVDVTGAKVAVGDGDVVGVPRDATLLPPSPARITTAASPPARRATMRATRATRGAGTRIAAHGTGGSLAF